MGVPLLLALSVAVRAEQPRIVLGETARVRLQISAAGAPPDARLTLWTSAGSVADVKRDSPDSFSAVYVAPPQRYPQVALILATVAAGASADRGWLAIPLIAKEKLPVQTKPGSRVEISLGGATYGPVRTDAEGRARVPARIPPGVHTALIRVRDPFGNINETSFDLRPPPFPRIRMLALGERASWTDADPVRLEIFAVAPDGKPAASADVAVVADRGQLGALQQRKPGLFEVAFRAPDRAGGVATIRARVAGDKEGETATIALLPGPPARIRLTASPSELAGEGSVRIAAEVLDGRDNPLPADAVRFSAEDFALEQEGPVARARIPAEHGAVRELRVKATDGKLESTISVALGPAPAEVALAEQQAPEDRAGRFALGALLGGQSNLSRANAGTLQAEVSMHPGVRAVEVLARAGLLQFASAHDALASGAKGELHGLSLAVGARASIPLHGPFSAHATALIGALRSFGTLEIDSGPAAGFSQGTAQWGPLFMIAAGASMRLRRGRAVAELQLSHAPGRGDLSGNLGGVGVCFGYLFALR